MTNAATPNKEREKRGRNHWDHRFCNNLTMLFIAFLPDSGYCEIISVVYGFVTNPHRHTHRYARTHTHIDSHRETHPHRHTHRHPSRWRISAALIHYRDSQPCSNRVVVIVVEGRSIYTYIAGAVVGNSHWVVVIVGIAIVGIAVCNRRG